LLVRVSPYDISPALAAPVDVGQSSGPRSTDAAACYSCVHGLALAVRSPTTVPRCRSLRTAHGPSLKSTAASSSSR